MLYLGVDLRTSTKRPSAVSAIDRNSQISFINSFYQDSELFQIAEEQRPALIALGVPLCLPKGLCCLEITCSCKLAAHQQKGREAELELARMGISYFFTDKGSITRSLIYRAIELKRKLSDLGHQIIEVYPHATKVILFGDNIPPKNSPKNIAFMRKRLPELVAGLDPYINALDRSALDCLINAHTALLHSHGATDTVGVPQEGCIVLPKLIQ